MQRWKTAVPMMLLCLLLCACSGPEDQLQGALNFRTELLSAESCGFFADLTATGEQEVFHCTLECRVGRDGVVTVTIVEPAELAGVTATVTSGGTELSFDGVRVDCGELKSSISPVAAPGFLYAAWTQGYIAAAGSEEGGVLTRYLMGSGKDERRVETWFSASGRPERCDVYENGEAVLQCSLRDFRLEESSAADAAELASSSQQ